MIFVPIITFLFLSVKVSDARLEDLIAVAQIFRHGQRTPLFFYPMDPHSHITNWPVGPGELTNEGKRQLYSLGQFTRKRYNGFISAKYNFEDIYVQTTDMDRTHMSAQTFLAGLYPPTKQEAWNPNLTWQPIPVHSVDRQIFSALPECPNYYLHIAEVLFNEDYIKRHNQFTYVFTNISENSGEIAYTVLDALRLYDTLFIENQFGMELPKWTKSMFPQPLSLLVQYAYKSFSYTDKLKKLSAGLLLQNITQFFENMVQDPSSSQKYQVFSGHDTNIAAILNTMGAFPTHLPRFGSSLFLELRNKSQNVIVNVWYKNGDTFKPVTMKGCKFDCNLKDFKALLNPWLVDKISWHSECNQISSTNNSKVPDLIKRRIKDFFNIKP